MIRPREFRVDQDAKVRLKRWPTRVEPYYRSQAHYEQLLGEHLAELRKLQDKHYAYNRYALLIVFQGMDASGKDGVIKHVMNGLNPQGCQVVSFKHPSARGNRSACWAFRFRLRTFWIIAIRNISVSGCLSAAD